MQFQKQNISYSFFCDLNSIWGLFISQIEIHSLMQVWLGGPKNNLTQFCVASQASRMPNQVTAANGPVLLTFLQIVTYRSAKKKSPVKMKV